jgi:hypothetical protein
VNEVYRSTFGRVMTVVAGGVAAAVVAWMLAVGASDDALATAPWLALFVLAVWAAFWRPCVEVSDGGVRLVNVSRTIDLPWPAVQSVTTRWALTLGTEYGTFTSWAAPAPSARSTVLTVRSFEKHATPKGATEGPRASELLTTDSGAAAELVKRRWERLVESGHLADARLERDRPVVRWHAGTLGLAAALVALGVLTW